MCRSKARMYLIKYHHKNVIICSIGGVEKGGGIRG